MSKHFGNVIAVDSLTLTVEPGEIVGFLGPNGAGKSTTIRVLSGVLRPTSGSVSVCGIDIATDPVGAKRRVGYMAENPYLYPKLTGREFVRFIAQLHGIDPAQADRYSERLFKVLGMPAKADQLIDGYSRGMKQKTALIAAMVHKPGVLLLDEPTSGMDPRSGRAVKDLLAALAERGTAVLFSTHLLEVAEQMCHRVAIIDRGRLRAVGTLDDLRSRARIRDASLEEIFLRVTSRAEPAGVPE